MFNKNVGKVSLAKFTKAFFSRPSPKVGRELQTKLDRMREDDDGPLAKNQPEPVTGP